MCWDTDEDNAYRNEAEMQSEASFESAYVTKVKHEVENKEEEISVQNKEENSKEQEKVPEMGFVHYIIFLHLQNDMIEMCQQQYKWTGRPIMLVEL